mgnify:CR=1 FL=1
MEVNLNQNNASLREALNNSNFAQFLSEHLSQNNISQSEITYLLNLFSNQLNNQNNLENSRNNNNLNNNSKVQNDAIAKRLTFFRNEVLHLNQLECANALDISQTYLSLIESGKRTISEELLNKYVEIFDINYQWLNTGNDKINILNNNSSDNALYYIQKKQNDSLKSLINAYSLDKDEIEFINHLLSLDKTKRRNFIHAIKVINTL